MIFLDQLSDAADGWPATGDIYECGDSNNGCSKQGSGGHFWRDGRVHLEVHVVTAINGLSVTIDPPLHSPDFRTVQSPGAWWGTFALDQIQNVGIENMTIDWTGAGSGPGIAWINAANVWLTGTRMLFRANAASFVIHNYLVQVFRLTARSNYYYGPNSAGGGGITNYAFSSHDTGSILAENNIFHRNASAIIPNDPEVGSVYGYNYITGTWFAGEIQLHSAASGMNLYEGNNTGHWTGEIIHGPHYFETTFRNLIDGHTNNASDGNADAGLNAFTNNRFFNFLGNVIGDTGHFATYEQICPGGLNCSATKPDQTAIFAFGHTNDNTGPGVITQDSNVGRTAMRWGNWDSVTTTTRFVAAEVPSGITNFPNPVPASQALPASFYYSSQPAWWGAPSGITVPPWPPIGPDVTGGSVVNSPTGDHANKIPARLCFENIAVDPAYSSSSPRILLFNAATCYIASSAPTRPLFLHQADLDGLGVGGAFFRGAPR